MPPQVAWVSSRMSLVSRCSELLLLLIVTTSGFAQLSPELPHACMPVPPWQVPLESQQPAHDCAHDSPLLPPPVPPRLVQAPRLHVWFAEQATQATPMLPQAWAVLPARQEPLESQHPVE